MRWSRRDRTKEAFWRWVIEGQPRSGLSVRAWCGRHDVRKTSFYWWRRQLSLGECPPADRQLARRDAEAMTLVPVRVTTDSPAGDAQNAFAMHEVPNKPWAATPIVEYRAFDMVFRRMQPLYRPSTT